MNDSAIQIFRTQDGQTEIQVKLEKDTVWLTQKQIAELFEKDSDTIGLHLNNIFKSGELEENSTTEKYSVVQTEGPRKVKRTIRHYNLDAIISVGYRVNSIRGVQFRIWANKILKEYLIHGYSINETVLLMKSQQLTELQRTIKLLNSAISAKELTNDENKGLLSIITDYSYALEILDQYDFQTLKIKDTSGKDVFRINYNDAIKQIAFVRKAFSNSELFGREKDESFKSSISSIYQTFEKNDLYPSIEEKAAHLLYFITKNHSFVDGNKRIAAFMFLYFLEKNKILFDSSGKKRIADNALVALTLMIAVSKPDEKDTIIKVIVNLINKNN